MLEFKNGLGRDEMFRANPAVLPLTRLPFFDAAHLIWPVLLHGTSRRLRHGPLQPIPLPQPPTP
jgi:hypothetical protein